MGKNKTNILNRLLVISILSVATGIVSAQDIEQVAKSKPVKITGGLSANTSLYGAWGMDSRQDPFFWQMVANMNFNFWGVVDMPFSAYFAKENVRYQQPSFSQFGMSPHYKSVTLHLGYRNMTFSPYSLAGLTFLGAGIEFQPKDSWIKANAMYGRFFRAISATDSAQNRFRDPSYERWGGGFSVTASNKKNELSLIVFKAADKPGSIPDPPASYGIAPAENLVIGIGAKAQVIPQIFVSADYTLSAYTADLRTEEKDFQKYTYLNNLGGLFTPRYSSSLHKALETSVNYNGGTFNAGITYKRIDPGYASLGSTFIENDLEDVLLNLSKSFANNKFTLSGNVGQQRNNLDGDKQTENKRVIGSANAAWSVNQSLNINANYSNFTSNTQPTLINFTDSIKYFQINENTSLSLNYNKGTAKLRHSVSLMVALQKATSLNRSATQSLETNNNMVNTSVSYQAGFPQKGLAATTSFQNSVFKNGLTTTRNYGPNIALNKELLKNKLKLTLSYGYNKVQLSGEGKNSGTQIIRFNSDFQAGKHQSLHLQTSYMRRKDAEKTGTLAPRELQASLSYQFTF
ncbi:MAG: hypothetical protein QM786_08510 [Breznakibacter sp.]